MKKITIINAYAGKNIGDAAILNIALEFIREAHKDCQISLLCEDVESFMAISESTQDITPFQLPYGYAIRGNKRPNSIIKISRFLIIYFMTYFFIFMNKYLSIRLPTKGFYSYIEPIVKADIVVGIGGGYFITNSKFRDYFGLLLSLLTVYIARTYKKKIIFLPISFGPFFTKLQEMITYKALTHTTVMARDLITLNKIRNIDQKKVIYTFYAPDLALFYKTIATHEISKLNSKYIVLTARDWLTDKSKQSDYESALARFIEQIHKNNDLKTVFIPMGINPVEDDDNKIAFRIKSKLKNKEILEIRNIRNIKELQILLSKAKVAICTRMHSAILCTTVGTPFIAIGYGHKTLGFVRSFGLEKWHLDIHDVQFSNLLKKFNNLIVEKNYFLFQQNVENEIKRIYSYKNKIIQSLS